MQPLELFDTLLSPDAIVQIGHGDCSVCSLWDTTRACNCAIAQQPDRRDFAAKPSTARTHPLRDLAAPRFPIAVRHGDVFGFALARCSAGAPGIAVSDGECPTGIHEPEHHRAIGIVTVSERVQAHVDVRDAINAFLFGWARYFSYGTHRAAFRGIDYYVYERVRDFLARRHKVKGRGTRQFSYDVVYGERGVLRIERLPWSLAPCASR